LKLAVSMSFPISKTRILLSCDIPFVLDTIRLYRILLLVYWHWISTKNCYRNDNNPWPWSVNYIKQTISVYMWHTVVHMTTKAVKSPTSVAHKYITIILYTQWSHTCFDQPCVLLQGYKIRNLDTLKYPTCYYHCFISMKLCHSNKVLKKNSETLELNILFVRNGPYIKVKHTRYRPVVAQRVPGS